ncbi:MAG: DUF962 domain-containing protein [Deltaproteobacteria bacterium]|nr:DUF962 domain-containing protein [Deltaproteobacteria bacterium]
MALIDRATVEAYEAIHQHPANRLLHALGTPVILGSLVTFPVAPWMSAALFVAGWGLQFIGHAIEGTPPQFTSRPIFLLVGPLLLVRRLTDWRATEGARMAVRR